MSEAEKAECKVYLEKQIKKLSTSLTFAELKYNNKQEQDGIERKLRIYNNLLSMLLKGK